MQGKIFPIEVMKEHWEAQILMWTRNGDVCVASPLGRFNT
jgi:hypothetical protein